MSAELWDEDFVRGGEFVDWAAGGGGVRPFRVTTEGNDYSAAVGSLRANFNIVIASKAATRNRMMMAGKAIGHGVAHVSGGATVSPATGLWSIGADREVLSGPVEIANGVTVRVTVPLQHSAQLYEALREVVPAVCERFSIPARWIHVEVTLQTAAHFQITGEPPSERKDEEMVR